jgi:hypothetical protein
MPPSQNAHPDPDDQPRYYLAHDDPAQTAAAVRMMDSLSSLKALGLSALCAEKFLDYPNFRGLLVVRQALDKHSAVLLFQNAVIE